MARRRCGIGRKDFRHCLQIILEQQVSLASAKACFDKLCRRVGDITPESLLQSTDAELKTDGFSGRKLRMRAILQRR
jgi:DNA-3-methyladenine glycosylase II